MGALTIRKLDEEVIRDLRVSAAKRGVSMEQEARDRLSQPLDNTFGETANPDGQRWRLKAAKEEILALGRAHARPVDHKAEADALYDYFDDE